MNNCDKFYKNSNTTVSKNCSLCEKYSFHEEILCYLLQSAQSQTENIECFAYQPNLSVVGENTKIENISPDESEKVELSEKQKWLKAYALQQWESNPDQVISNLNFHICLITKNREPIFQANEVNLDLSPVFSNLGAKIGGAINLLCYGKDHILLHANISPKYSVDEAVNIILSPSKEAIKENYPKILSAKSNIFEISYFAESIG